jgi:hypothetical protein
MTADEHPVWERPRMRIADQHPVEWPVDPLYDGVSFEAPAVPT